MRVPDQAVQAGSEQNIGSTTLPGMVDNCEKAPLLIVKVSDINNYRVFWGTVITQMGHILRD